MERGSPFLKENKLCCRGITRLGTDLNVGLISVKFYLQDLRQTLLCGTWDEEHQIDSHFKSLNVCVFSCVLEKYSNF